MKRDDHVVLGEAALALAVGGLSIDETTLDGGSVTDAPISERERTEDFLYFHLCCARRAREEMDGGLDWGAEYNAHHRAREIALAAASRNYQRLLGMGGAIPVLLAQMIDAEGGLKP